MSDSDTDTRLLDPNYLSFISRSLDEANNEGRTRKAHVSISDNLTLRQAHVLDSLAYVLVSEPENQVVAVGAQLLPGNTNTPVRILVAENHTVFPEVKKHLNDIFTRLQRIHATQPQRDGSYHVQIFIEAPDTPHQSELVGLELAILKYSWAKLRHRFTKNQWHRNIITTVDDICGSPADQRVDLTEDERQLLNRLQMSPDLDRKQLEDLSLDVELIESVLSGSADDHHSVARVRLHLHAMLAGKPALEKKSMFLQVWNLFIQKRLRREVRKTPDVFHWLCKVLSVCEHYLRIANVAISVTLAQLLLRGVEIICVNNPPIKDQPTLSVDNATLEKILVTAHCESSISTDTPVDEFLQAVAQAHPGVNVENGKFEATPTRFIHCECALLAFIHNQTAIPYIGVSKLSCAFCDIYFAVYRDVTNTNICTRGAHNQTSPWSSPVLDNDPVVEGQIREALCSKMLEKIGNSWKDYCRTSRGSQNTIASSHESEVVGHDVIAAFEKSRAEFRATGQ